MTRQKESRIHDSRCSETSEHYAQTGLYQLTLSPTNAVLPQPHSLRLVGFEGRRPQLITSFMLLPGIYSCPRITSTMAAWSRYRGTGNRPMPSFPVSDLHEGTFCLFVRNSRMVSYPLTNFSDENKGTEL